jgi:hypothetical protein
MSCWHGCVHGHYWAYAYGPPAYGPPPWHRRPPRGWDVADEDLEEYLADLEAEVAQVRADIEAIRRSRTEARRTSQHQAAGPGPVKE